MAPLFHALVSTSVGASYTDSLSDAPWTTKVSLAAMVLYTVMVLVSGWWYGCKRAYAQGSRIGQPRGCRDGRVLQSNTMLGLTIFAFVLKVVALAVDWWTTVDSSYGDTHLGSFAFRENGQSVPYPDASWVFRVLRASSYYVFAAVVASLLVSLDVLAVLHSMRTGADAVSLRAERLYRTSGMLAVLSSTAWSMWILGQWLYLFNASSESDNTNFVWPGPSQYLLLAAVICDSFVHSGGKATLLNTVPYGATVAMGQPLVMPVGQQVVYAQPMSHGAYMPLGHQQFAPVQGYQSQPAYGHPQQVQQQAYGQPQQQQQQYVPPPAFAPTANGQANFMGQPQQFAPQQTQSYPQL